MGSIEHKNEQSPKIESMKITGPSLPTKPEESTQIKTA